MNISITKNGKALDKSLYTIDYKTRTFSSNEHCLVIDCPHDNWTFKTGSNCTFKTGSDCTFDAGYSCTFDAGYSCTFDTGSECTFDAGSKCVLVRRDVYEVIELPGNKTIKLNGNGIKGYTFVEEEIKKENMIKIGDKQISESTILEALKKYFE